MSAMRDRQAFLAKIRRALGHDPVISRGAAALFVTPEPSAQTLPPDGSLLEQLSAAGAAMQTPVTAVSDPATAATAIARLAVESQPEWGDTKQIVCWDHPLVNALQLKERLAADKIAVHRLGSDTLPIGSAPPKEAWRQMMADAYIGITSALYCLADTATLVLQTAPGQPRSASLLPSIHVAVIHQSQIIADLKSLYRLLETDFHAGGDPLGNSLTMITGPSKTADIEATMVYGAHGPRALHIVVIAEKDKKPLPS
jgi:L-lactate dehydrogenase complex protein LldG